MWRFNARQEDARPRFLSRKSDLAARHWTNGPSHGIAKKPEKMKTEPRYAPDACARLRPKEPHAQKTMATMSQQCGKAMMLGAAFFALVLGAAGVVSNAEAQTGVQNCPPDSASGSNQDPHTLQASCSEYVNTATDDANSCGSCLMRDNCPASSTYYRVDARSFCGPEDQCIAVTGRRENSDGSAGGALCCPSGEQEYDNRGTCEAPRTSCAVTDQTVNPMTNLCECPAGQGEFGGSTCRLPEGHGDCFSVSQSEPIHDESAPGNCRAPNSDQECADAFSDRPFRTPVGTGFQCVPPGTSEQCRAFDPTMPIYGAELADQGIDGSDMNECIAGTDERCAAIYPDEPHADSDGSCFEIMQATCTPLGQVLRGEGAAAMCANPDNINDCLSAAGAGFTVIEGGVCQARCNSGRAPGDGSVCRTRIQADCTATGQLLRNGNCENPRNIGNCTSIPEAGFTVIERDVCAVECDTNRIPGEDGRCAQITQADCESMSQTLGDDGSCRDWVEAIDCHPMGEVLDGAECRPPASNSECARINSQLPLFENRACRALYTQADCTPAGQVLKGAGIGARCENPDNINDCLGATGAGFTVIEEGVCSVQCDNERIDGTGSVCRNRTQADCTLAGQILRGSGAAAACENPTNIADCLNVIGAGFEVIERGVCSDACDAGRIAAINEGNVCRAPETGDCLSTEFFDTTASQCMPINQAYCASIGQTLADNGRCRTLEETADCLPNGQILIGSACSLPRNNEECARVDSLRPRFEAGACTFRHTQEDCSASGQYLDQETGECRGAQTAGECGIAIFGDSGRNAFMDRGRCVVQCPLERSVVGEGNVCQEPARADEESLPRILPIIPAVAIVSYGIIAQSYALQPALGYGNESGGSGETWTYGGRINYRGENWTSYVSASGESAESGIVYETGGRYEGRFWGASYASRETSKTGEYNFGVRTGWKPGMWEARPNLQASLAYEAETGAWMSSSALGVDILWVAHKWQVKQNTGIAWEAEDDLSEPRIRLDIERIF